MTKTRTSAAETVFNALMDSINAMEYVPGDKLPSENELAAQYKVSRVTVRKALNMLLALGIIETRNGGGSYVQKFKFSRITDAAAKIMVNHVTTEDILQYRRLLEIDAIRTVSMSAVKPVDINQLCRLCDQMEESARQGNYESFANYDFDFHRYICKMSHNALFVYSYDMLGSIMKAHLFSRYHIAELTEEQKRKLMVKAARSHREIVDAISGGKCDDLLAHMLEEDYTDIGIS